VSSPQPPATAGHRQLPLALRYPPDQRFETYVSAEPEVPAQVRATAVGEGGSIYLVGAPGTGKSHLALAACACSEASGRPAGYVAAAAVAGRLREALQGLDSRHLVAIDGLEAVATDPADALALFDFHNRMHDAGHVLLYTATQAPDALGVVLADLRSRLAQCTRLPLASLDDEGRREVLRRRALRRGLQIDAAAVDWLLRHARRDLASLTGLLDTLDRASLAAQRRITMPFLRELLDSGVL
jgi:DnaA-homolog protein